MVENHTCGSTFYNTLFISVNTFRYDLMHFYYPIHYIGRLMAILALFYKTKDMSM